MTDPFESTHPAEIAPYVGNHIIYTYANGWLYEVYLRTERTLDYAFMTASSVGAG